MVHRLTFGARQTLSSAPGAGAGAHTTTAPERRCADAPERPLEAMSDGAHTDTARSQGVPMTLVPT